MQLGEVNAVRGRHDLVVLEGFHAIKHAVRFGGEVLGAWTADLGEMDELRRSLAPDVEIPFELVDLDELKAVVSRGQAVAVARRPVQPRPEELLVGPGHMVLLEDPRHLGNLGAVVRVAAAAGASGVLCTGRLDPWHPDALRGSAGLHFAVPVHHIREVITGDRDLVALDPEGEDLSPAAFPSPAVLAFGTERHGITDELLARADRRIALPMAPGVSSMNLATSVAATLYALKMGVAS